MIHLRRILAVLVVFLMVISSFGLDVNVVFASDDSSSIVNFPDPNLKQALIEKGADTNRDGNITRGEMAYLADLGHVGSGLDSLDLGKRGITNLTGLEYAVNLRTLGLSYNKISDLSPLSKLSKLETLILDDNNVSDLKPIMNLPNLRLLSLRNIGTSDLSAFANSNLPSLNFLYVDNNNISNISPLSKLTELSVLSFVINDVSDISALRNMTKMRELHIATNKISDISPLQNMKYLVYLQIFQNNITDISPLRNMSNLDMLEAEYNNISDISALAALSKLRLLTLDYNQIADLSPLSSLYNLEGAKLYENKISDITPLSRLTKLVDLNLGKNNISDISPLENLTAMEYLFLNDNAIGDISPLKNMVRLKRLFLVNNNISDINTLAKLVNLDTLKILGNKITDISVLSKLPKLKDVDITQDNLTVPNVSGVVDGAVYTKNVIITFDHGTATIKNLSMGWTSEYMGWMVIESGTEVSREGKYALKVDDQKGNIVTINFTIKKSGIKVIGVEDGATYNSSRQISFASNVTAKLNGKAITSGVIVSENGEYTLELADDLGESATIKFKIKAVPIVYGVENGQTYPSARTITFNEGTATLNGNPFTSGSSVSDNGVYELIVKNASDSQTIVNFTIYKALDTIKFEANDMPSDWATPTILEAYNTGLVPETVLHGYTKPITREQFCELIIKTVEAKTGKPIESLLKENNKSLSDNPFIDTTNKSIIAAYQLGIIKGKNSNKFNPNDSILRKEAAVILLRTADNALKLNTSQSKTAFEFRETIDGWAREGINYVVASVIMSGVGEGRFDPNNTFTVEQAIATAMRLYRQNE